MEVIFGETEIEEGKNVCVISDTDARQLFGTDDVVGMSLDITCYDSSNLFASWVSLRRKKMEHL